jgi:uncharacterized protein (DUF302 family)
MSESLAFQSRVHLPFEQALERVTDALKAQGFGVLTRIDVKKTLKEKLGEEFRDYVILGACNPTLAHRALSARPDVGLLLPCNVTLEQTPDGVLVSVADPGSMLSLGDFAHDAVVSGVAAEASQLLRAVSDSLTSQQ